MGALLTCIDLSQAKRTTLRIGTGKERKGWVEEKGGKRREEKE